jgi:hypothetical protein
MSSFDLRSIPRKKLSFSGMLEGDLSFASSSYPNETRITFQKRKLNDSISCDRDKLFPRPSLVYRKLKRHEYSQEDGFDNHKLLFKKESLNADEILDTTKLFVKYLEEKTPPSHQVLSGERISFFRSRTTPDFDNSVTKL